MCSFSGLILVDCLCSEAQKYPAVRLRQVEKDTAAALDEGGLAK